MKSHRKPGYVMGMLAAAMYGLNPLFALPLYEDGMDAWSVLLFRYLLSLPILAGITLWQGVDFRLKRGEVLQLFVLGMQMAASSIFLYLAYNYMDASIASTILFVYPILTAVLMSTVFREHIHKLVWLCLLTATVGIAVLYRGDGVHNLSLIGTLLVIISAFTYAIYLVFINKGTVHQMPASKLTFYVLLFGSLLIIGGVIWQGHVMIPQGIQWGYSFGSALFPTALSLIFTSLAIHRIGSTDTAILGALEPLTAVFIGLTIFGESISWRSAMGITLIIVAVTLVVAKDKLLLQLSKSRAARHKGRR